MKPKKKNTVITIDAALHEEVRKYCEENGVKIGFSPPKRCESC